MRERWGDRILGVRHPEPPPREIGRFYAFYEDDHRMVQLVVEQDYMDATKLGSSETTWIPTMREVRTVDGRSVAYIDGDRWRIYDCDPAKPSRIAVGRFQDKREVN